MMEKIPNVLSNRQLYKKAYLIEFYKDDKVKPVEVFTFSVPPKSEELTYSQRKTEVKTFGGLHVDDYGIDAVKINLSGSTINQSIKRIYTAGTKFGSDLWLSGEGEIYHLRDRIIHYKSLEFLKENKNAKILIYDLSKYTGLRTSAIDNYWQAFLGDFKIRRSDDRPFTYNYTLEFTGVPYKGEPLKKPLPMGSQALGTLQTTLNGLKKALDFMSNIEALVDDALGYVDQVSDLMNILGSVMTQGPSTITNIMGSVSRTTTGLIGGARRIVDGINSLMSLPRTIQLKALNIGLEIQTATNGLMRSTATLVKNCHDMFDPDGDYWSIPKSVLDQFAMNNEEFKDSIDIMLNRAENAANEVAALGKSSEIPDVTEGNPDPETGEPTIVLSYGDTEIMINETDTLESLATEYFGDPDRAGDIAAYNQVPSISDLSPGDTIRIPITQRTAKISNNLIFARREDRDNYGRDIFLTDDGSIVVSHGDYSLMAGVKNLSQAILLRLRENNAKRIRVNAYGIRTRVSDPVAGVAYIITSVKVTVNNDPRVSAVNDVQFEAAGDFLDVNVFYNDINHVNGRISGRV